MTEFFGDHPTIEIAQEKFRHAVTEKTGSEGWSIIAVEVSSQFRDGALLIREREGQRSLLRITRIGSRVLGTAPLLGSELDALHDYWSR